jgi:hypothetical protein
MVFSAMVCWALVISYWTVDTPDPQWSHRSLKEKRLGGWGRVGNVIPHLRGVLERVVQAGAPVLRLWVRHQNWLHVLPFRRENDEHSSNIFRPEKAKKR